MTRFSPDIALGGSLLETGARTSSSSGEGSALETRASNLRREGSATEVRRSLAQVDEELYRRNAQLAKENRELEEARCTNGSFIKGTSKK